MKNTILKILGLSFIVLQLTACGSTTDNLDILNSTTIPIINSFASTPTYSSGSSFTDATPYLVFSTSGFGTYLAPARGIVGEIGASTLPGFTGTSFVTIIHSGRVATRVHGIQSMSVRSGDAIAAGGTVGVFYASSSSALQVLLDGVSVCPLTFLSATVRQSLFNNPCR